MKVMVEYGIPIRIPCSRALAKSANFDDLATRTPERPLFSLIYFSSHSNQAIANCPRAPKRKSPLRGRAPFLPISDEIETRIHDRRKALTNLRVTPQNQYFLKRFAAFCSVRGLRCRIIIEPIPASMPRTDVSMLAALAPGVEVVDSTASRNFPMTPFATGCICGGPTGPAIIARSWPTVA